MTTFSQNITNHIDQVIYSYIASISEKYSINQNELTEMWNGGKVSALPAIKTITKTTLSKPTASRKVTTTNPDLEKLLKADLIVMCKEKGLKTTGTKQDLINRIEESDGKNGTIDKFVTNLDEDTENNEEEKDEKEDSIVSIAKQAAAKKVAAAKSTSKTTTSKSIVSKPTTVVVENSTPSTLTKAAATKLATTPVVKNVLVPNIPAISIRRNNFNNYEHPETGIVFDSKTKNAIGKQNDDGTIEPLTADLIDICNQYKFTYDLPLNLNSKTSKDVKVEELDDEEEEEIVEEEIIEEEEEYEEEEEIVED